MCRIGLINLARWQCPETRVAEASGQATRTRVGRKLRALRLYRPPLPEGRATPDVVRPTPRPRRLGGRIVAGSVRQDNSFKDPSREAEKEGRKGWNFPPGTTASRPGPPPAPATPPPRPRRHRPETSPTTLRHRAPAPMTRSQTVRS